MAVFECASVATTPKAVLKGAYTAAEACPNAIGQTESGQGFIKAMMGALDIANIDSRDIKIVKTHGTGTKSNNVAEKAALEDMLYDFVATSYKQHIGHTMGASGLLETLLLIDDIAVYKYIPAIANRTSSDERYLSQDFRAPEGDILSLAAGMGNIYSAAVLSLEI